MPRTAQKVDDLAAEGETDHPIEMFQLDRF